MSGRPETENEKLAERMANAIDMPGLSDYMEYALDALERLGIKLVHPPTKVDQP